MPIAPPPCDIPREVIRFEHPLPNLSRQLAGGGPVTIVAIGSSSTEGDGAIDKTTSSYPVRLEAVLRLQFCNPDIHVINQGHGGEEADTELARFDTDVIAPRPCLVVWQVGTNAAWKPGQYDLDQIGDTIATGLQKLASLPMDCVMMDLQYAPDLLTDAILPRTRRMEALIAEKASAANVNVFKRFELMRTWHDRDKIPFETMISNFDNNMLHQNDWSYNCLAQALAFSMTDAVSGAAA